MKTNEGRILEATVLELRQLWIRDEYYELMSFGEFLERVQKNGTIILPDIRQIKK